MGAIDQYEQDNNSMQGWRYNLRQFLKSLFTGTVVVTVDYIYRPKSEIADMPPAARMSSQRWPGNNLPIFKNPPPPPPPREKPKLSH